jgi:hypothetical protein
MPPGPVMLGFAKRIVGLRVKGAVLRSRPAPAADCGAFPQRPQSTALGALALEDAEAPRGRPLRTTPERLSMAQTHICSSSWSKRG